MRVLFSSSTSAKFRVLQAELSVWPHGAEGTRLCMLLIFHHLLAAFTLRTAWLFCQERYSESQSLSF